MEDCYENPPELAGKTPEELRFWRLIEEREPESDGAAKRSFWPADTGSSGWSRLQPAFAMPFALNVLMIGSKRLKMPEPENKPKTDTETDNFIRLKATWEVTAGLIPGEPMEQYTRLFHYTSAQREEDERLCDGNPAHHAIYSRMRAEVLDYYAQVSMPHLNNWARIEFIWY